MATKSQVPAPLDAQTSVSVLGGRETNRNDQNTPLQQNEAQNLYKNASLLSIGACRVQSFHQLLSRVER